MLTDAQRAELLQLCGQMLSGPQYLTPEAAGLIAQARHTGSVETLLSSWGGRPQEGGRYTRQGAVAVYEIGGPILSSCPSWLREYGLNDARGLAADFDAMAADPTVSAVVLAMHCPGGVDTNRDEATDALDRLRRAKPVVAHAGMACSLGYWFAAHCSEIVVSSNSYTGSIGAYWAHQDLTGMLGAEGIKITEVAGRNASRKLERSPFRALTDEALATLQAEADAGTDAFQADVARSRRVPIGTIRALAGRMISGSAEALANGLADSEGTLADAVRRAARLAREADRPARTPAPGAAVESESGEEAKARAPGVTVPLPATAGTSTEKPMSSKTLLALAAVLGAPVDPDNDAAMAAQVQDLAARAKASDGYRAEAGKVAGLQAELTAAKASVEQIASERDALKAEVATFRQAETERTARAEEAAWSAALADAKVSDSARETVVTLAKAQAQPGETPAQQVGRIAAQPHMASCFATKTPEAPPRLPASAEGEGRRGDATQVKPWEANINLGLRNQPAA